MASPVITPQIEARFWSKVSKSDGCWEWQGGRTPFGYGQFQIGRRPWGAHRVSYVIANGAVPDGLHILHSCDNPPCVRPDHLRTGTPKDNGADQILRNRKPTYWSLPVDVRTAANVLGISPATVRRQIRAGRIKAVGRGRYYIQPRELERYRAESLGTRRPK